MVAIAVAVAGSIVTISPAIATEATKEAVATTQMGILAVDGTLTSGGSIDYRFYFNTTATGPLAVTGLIASAVKNEKWSVKIPAYSNTLTAGTTRVTGPSITVPTNFTGAAVLTVTVKFKGRAVGTRSINFTISAPVTPVVAGSVSTNLYDAGFENSVTLNGGIVSTVGLGSTPTFKWMQTSGKTVVLSSTTNATTSFKTDALTNFVDMATGLYVNDPDDAGYTNAIYVAPENRFGSIGGIPLDNESAAAATYNFRLLVSNGSITRTGLFTVACSIQTPAQPNVAVGVTAYFKSATNSANWSLLQWPTGSAATLQHTNGLIAALRPDLEGIYIIKDNVSGATLTNTAASYTGVEFCGICHGQNNNVGQTDLVTPWSQTRHASMAQRGIDGILSSHYSESCFVCHTLGYNKATTAAINGNFYAVEQQLGWKFPSVLTNGNYAAMPSQLQNLANIQCESCHGPGSRHPGSPSVSLNVKVCASCHQDGTNHVHPQQWAISPHAGAYENLSSHGTSASCARCHAPAGFISATASNSIAAYGAITGITNPQGSNSVVLGTGPATCQVCHDPHDAFLSPVDPTTGLTVRHQLRVYDTVMLGNPLKATSLTISNGLGGSLTTANMQLTNSTVTVTNAGLSAACMVCHNAREWPTQVQVSGSNSNKMYYMTTAPSMSTAGDIFAGGGGYDYGQTMGNSFHTSLASCQTCHMYVLRAPSNGVAQDSIAIDGVVTPVTATVYAQFKNLLGDHTFEMSFTYLDTNGVQHVAENIAACNQCHGSFAPVSTFDFKAGNAQDYSGNGVIAGIQTETQGVLNNLGNLLKATGVTITTNVVGGVTNVISVSSSAGYSTNAVIAAAQHKATWNWNLEYYEGSHGVHNTQYTIRLLQTSYTDLSTNFYGNSATNTYQGKFPNAFLR